MRSALYALAKLLGDINAIRRGRVGQRVWNRAAGKASSRVLRKVRL